VAVEFNDYIALVEAPLESGAHARGVQHGSRMYPNKPIKYVVNSHNHLRSSGRHPHRLPRRRGDHHAFEQHDFYKNEVLSHDVWTLDPDRLSLYPPTEFDEAISSKTSTRATR
jgi:hypothetical protein